jgi:hypothetical protein
LVSFAIARRPTKILIFLVQLRALSSQTLLLALAYSPKGTDSEPGEHYRNHGGGNYPPGADLSGLIPMIVPNDGNSRDTRYRQENKASDLEPKQVDYAGDVVARDPHAIHGRAQGAVSTGGIGGYPGQNAEFTGCRQLRHCCRFYQDLGLQLRVNSATGHEAYEASAASKVPGRITQKGELWTSNSNN